MLSDDILPNYCSQEISTLIAFSSLIMFGEPKIITKTKFATIKAVQTAFLSILLLCCCVTKDVHIWT